MMMYAKFVRRNAGISFTSTTPGRSVPRPDSSRNATSPSRLPAALSTIASAGGLSSPRALKPPSMPSPGAICSASESPSAWSRASSARPIASNRSIGRSTPARSSFIRRYRSGPSAYPSFAAGNISPSRNAA